MQAILSQNYKTNKIAISIGLLIVISIFALIQNEYKIFETGTKIVRFANKIDALSELSDAVNKELQNNTNLENSNNNDNEIENEATQIRINLNEGRNSVTIKDENGHVRYDLGGKTHENIKTPHKHIYKNNMYKGEIKSIRELRESPVKLTKEDIEIVKTYLQNIKK